MVLKKPIATVSCAHHWIIEVASGPKSNGVCIKCSQTGQFKNSISTDHFWLNQEQAKRHKENG